MRNKPAYSMINKTNSHLSSIREAMEAMVNCTLIFAINACSSCLFFTCIRGIRVDHFVKLHVFTFLVPCYDVSYAFRVSTMFRILVSNMMCMSDNVGSNTTDVTNGEGTAYPTGPPESTRSGFLVEFVLLDL